MNHGYGPPPGPPGPPGGQPPGYGGPPGARPPGYGPPGAPGYGGMSPPPPPQQTPGTDPLAIVSLISGIMSLLLCWCCALFWVILGPTALICGFISMSRIKKNPQQYSGHGLALGGVITGGISVAVGLLLFIVGVGMQLAQM